MTERYILQFPRGVAVSIFPYDTAYLNDEKFLEEFRRNIRDAFREYTVGTNPDYILQDKIMFIDLIRELNFKISSRQILNECIRNLVDDAGSFDLEDSFDTDDLEQLIDEGISRYSRSWTNWSPDKHVNEMAMKFIWIAIKVVMNYIPYIEPVKPRGDEE
ncbi:hypothetical protein WMO23_05945 [Megasphaera sp. CLA-AA-H81]|uniref:Uncharacterized protein n=1 Tax=Megasphaera intestinihominis TaxID=3133159 RepID=A0ABV1CVU2_9FIRM